MGQNQPVVSVLSRRIEHLEDAVNLGQGRVDPEVLESVQQTLDRSASRRQLSAEHTVIGFFGATGSGKSSLFNAVIGQKVAKSAARRPTTSTAQAAVWGRAGSEELLDWLQVENRVFLDSDGEQAAEALNQAQVPVEGGMINRMKHLLGRGETETKSGGLILLDLPDFDSVEKSNREIVSRMAGFVDVLVWVFDPQKYADAVIHHDFIAPLAQHGAVTMAVLNQADRLDSREIPAVLDSLQRLLAEDGLSGSLLAAPMAVSAVTGEGLDRLRTALGRVAVEKSAAVARIEADVNTAVDRLSEHDGAGLPDGVTGTGVRQLDQGLYAASGAEAICKAAGQTYQLHAGQNTGWIATRWLLKFRKDPLKRLNLHRSDEGSDITRSSLPPMSTGQVSAASSAIRRFSNGVAEGVSAPWNYSIRDAARSHESELPEALERAIASVDFGATKKRWWWVLLNIVQWLAIVLALAGLLWLTGLALAQYFQIPLPEAPTVEGYPIPVPTLLVATGLLLGIVTAILGKICAVAGRKMYQKKISRRIFEQVHEAGQDYVVAPVEEEINRLYAYRDALENAR